MVGRVRNRRKLGTRFLRAVRDNMTSGESYGRLKVCLLFETAKIKQGGRFEVAAMGTSKRKEDIDLLKRYLSTLGFTLSKAGALLKGGKIVKGYDLPTDIKWKDLIEWEEEQK